MDSAGLINLRERLQKEHKWTEIWRQENKACAIENGEYVEEPKYEKPNHKSAAMLALEQRMGAEPSPFVKKNYDASKALYYGVSENQQGRYAYLKQRGRQGPGRYKWPVQSSMEVGWTVLQKGNPAPKPDDKAFCHKPVLQKVFYRPNGNRTSCLRFA